MLLPLIVFVAVKGLFKVFLLILSTFFSSFQLRLIVLKKASTIALAIFFLSFLELDKSNSVHTLTIFAIKKNALAFQ